MAGDPTIRVKITVPYSGEIKRGLLIIINSEEAFGTCLITEGGSNFNSVSSKYQSAITDIEIENITYSNGIFTLTLLTGKKTNCKVAFLQLNLD